MEGVDSSLAFRIARRRRDAINGKLSPTEGPAASRSVNNDVDTAAVCDRPCCHGRRNREVWGTMSPSLLGPGGIGGTGGGPMKMIFASTADSLYSSTVQVTEFQLP